MKNSVAEINIIIAEGGESPADFDRDCFSLRSDLFLYYEKRTPKRGVTLQYG
jgi:hypothetical protein